MEIKILTKTRKKLNGIFLISIVFTIAPWLIIFPIFSFYDEKFTIAIILMILSLVSICMALLIGLIRLFSHTTIIIEKHSDYVVTLNTTEEVSAIKKAAQIEFTKNYVHNNTLNLSVELNNKEAFKLLKYATDTPININIEFKETSFLEQDPKEWFKSLMSMADAAS
ncbi:hypothetical protein [Kordia jejudonensis]|uniref:hypothetical protein n=1 Tax=Kordia jejudonensis TaxID=1348245 RepID=UPI0006292F1C|nr:hypothetical protein [Kordia jejudonensis]